MNAAIVRNSIIKSLILRFDFIIRLFYCKLRFYKIISLIFPRVYSSDYESLNSYFFLISANLKTNGFDLNGKSVLEIGPGNSYINAYNFMLNGARSVTLIDKYSRHSDSERDRDYIRKEIEYIKTKNGIKDLIYIDENSCKLNPNYIAFIEGDLSTVVFDGRFDFICSIAVLHHIRDFRRYIEKMHSILNGGGMMYHVVDLKDKFHFFGSPFLFYKYSDFMWENFLTDDAVTYTNRLRYQDYIDTFRECGFDLIAHQTTTYEIGGVSINEKFAGRKDLHIGDAQFLLKKR